MSFEISKKLTLLLILSTDHLARLRDLFNLHDTGSNNTSSNEPKAPLLDEGPKIGSTR